MLYIFRDGYYLRYFYGIVYPGEGHGLGIFFYILIILFTFIRSHFELYPPQQVIQKDKILSITDL